jgi:hypothetical protein
MFVTKKKIITNAALSFGQSIRNIDFTEKHINLVICAQLICFVCEVDISYGSTS